MFGTGKVLSTRTIGCAELAAVSPDELISLQGIPAAYFPDASCLMAEKFGPHNIMIDREFGWIVINV
jgi:hypothetical protein